MGSKTKTPPAARPGGTSHPPDVWVRHPADIARLLVAGIVLALGMALANTYPTAVRDVSSSLVELVLHLPSGVRAGLLGATQLAALAAPVGVTAILVYRRRFRLLGVTALAAAIGAIALALVQGRLDRTVPSMVIRLGDGDSWVSGADFPSGAYLAGLTAAVLVLGTVTTRRWTRVMHLGVAVAAFCRMVTAVSVPLNLVVTVALGAVVGSAVLAVLGSPQRRISLGDAAEAARRAGVTFTEIRAVDRPGEAAAFEGMVTTAADREPRPAVMSLIGREDRNAELMFRALRWLRTKGIEERPLSWTPGTRVRHEALATTLAGRAVSAPEVLGIAETPDDDAAIVLGETGGLPLAERDDLADAELAGVWEQVWLLAATRVAHRALHGGNIEISASGVVTLVGFGAAVVAAEDTDVAADLAEALVAVALVVGVDRAVSSATSSDLTVDQLAAALPLLQPAALSSDARRRLKREKSLVEDLRSSLAGALEVDDIELAPVQRVSRKQIVTVVALALTVGVVLAFVSNSADVWDSFQDADWSYVPFILATVVVSYLASGWALQGSITVPLPFLRTTEVMLGQTVLNRFTPANAGGMALRVRYLQKNGADLTVAATGVGLTSASSGVVQVVMLVGLFLWAGSSGELAFTLPSASFVAVVMLGVLAAAGVVYLTPWGRRVIFGRLKVVVSDAWRELSTLAKSPSKLVALFGGAFIMKLTSIVAFQLTCAAFGVDFQLARAGVLYMTANTVASAAPTPGGLGAMEAALVAALTGAGVDGAEALSIVLVYRLITFWLPVLPSWVALLHLRRVDAV